MTTAHEVYRQTVASLPRSERLRLAALILQDLSDSAAADLDYSDTWTEEDVTDVTAASLKHAAERYPEEDDLV
jgi:hypothetical protein